MGEIEVFKSIGNPFLETEDSLIQITKKHTLDDKASNLVRIAKEIGRQQYNTFVQNRLRNGRASVYDNIKENNLSLLCQKNSIVTSRSNQEIVSIKSDRQLYGRFYSACQSRKGNLNSFFTHENNLYQSLFLNMISYGNVTQSRIYKLAYT